MFNAILAEAHLNQIERVVEFSLIFISIFFDSIFIEKFKPIIWIFEPYLSSLPLEEYSLSLTFRSTCFIKAAL